MTPELRELYQQVILDHNKNPKNYKQIPEATHESDGYNPLCGDRLHLALKVDDDVVTDVGFQGSGCAISKASASVMTTLIKGKTTAEIDQLFKQFQGVITSSVNEAINHDELGKLAVFAGVREFPARVKCAALAWHTVNDALNQKTEITTTE